MGQQFVGPLSRRRFLGHAAAATATTVAAGSLAGKALGATPRAAGPVGLPSPQQMRADVQAMVDFGPRLVGTDAHNRFADWAESEFEAAGLQVLPCENYRYKRWDHQSSSLEVLDGSSPGPVSVGSTYVRSGSTPAEGLTAPLFYGGQFPVANGVAAIAGAPAQDPAAAAAWKASVGDQARGKIVVVDVDIPGRLTFAIFVAIQAYLQWPGHSIADWSARDFTRTWLGPWPELQALKDVGAVGAVFLFDAPQAAVQGTYSNHVAPYQDTPTLFVGSEVAEGLREQAKQAPTANLKVIAPTVDSVVRSVTAILPGESDEVQIIASHSDGQNAFEENGTVAVVQLARHYASLPADQRLKRTLVFFTYPGHTGGYEPGSQDSGGRRGYLPEVPGWIERHPDLIDRAAGAVFIEHLGAKEYVFADGKGYRHSGEFEPYGIWATQGAVQEQTIAAVQASGISSVAVLKPPIEVTPGQPFQQKGIPHVAGIAGPSYLLVVSDSGEMEKFDETHAAQQLELYADIIGRLDKLDRQTLRAGDPTLGQGYTEPDRSSEIGCVAQPTPSGTDSGSGAGGSGAGPAQTITVPVPASPATATSPATAASTLTVKFYGRRRKYSGVVVTIAASSGTTSGVTVELRRGGKAVARTKAVSVAQAAKRVVLKRSNDRKFAVGSYTLVVRSAGKELQRRAVRLGK